MATKLGTLLAFARAVSPALAQRDLSKVEIKPEKVAGNFWMLTGAAGNIGVSAGPEKK